mgnify:CR=1 FL=1
MSRNLTNPNDIAAFEGVGSFFGSSVTHELLLDLRCDGSVDSSKEFKTPYYSILPRTDGADVLISEYMNVTVDGLHCFAFAVDVNNELTETSEGNNQSQWREFQAGADDDSAAPDMSTFNLEVSVHTAGYASLVQDWTSEDIVISEGQEIAFRWDGPQYEQCVPLLSSETPGVLGNLSPIERNTLSENIHLDEHTGYYEVRCSVDGNTRVESIHITVGDVSDQTDSSQATVESSENPQTTEQNFDTTTNPWGQNTGS